jgi:hypothetical protein
MYGMIPSAKRAIRDSPPPLKVFRRFRTPPPPNCSERVDGLDDPGTGMCDPSR